MVREALADKGVRQREEGQDSTVAVRLTIYERLRSAPCITIDTPGSLSR